MVCICRNCNFEAFWFIEVQFRITNEMLHRIIQNVNSPAIMVMGGQVILLNFGKNNESSPEKCYLYLQLIFNVVDPQLPYTFAATLIFKRYVENTVLCKECVRPRVERCLRYS